MAEAADVEGAKALCSSAFLHPSHPIAHVPKSLYTPPGTPSPPVCARQPSSSTYTLGFFVLAPPPASSSPPVPPPSPDVAMPSLRRTLSSPSVRSSPYAYPSSSTNANAHAPRAANPQPRRSSGSDTGSRRVLADIDWWLVHDTQRDFVADPVGTEEDSDDQGAAENVQLRHGAPNVLAEDHVATPPPVAAPAAAISAGSAMGGFEGDDLLSSPLWDVSTDDDSFGMGYPEVCS